MSERTAVVDHPAAAPSSDRVAGWRRRGKIPVGLALAATAVALLALVPVGYLIEQALSGGWGQVSDLLFRPLVGTLLAHTIWITAATTVGCAVLGVAVAWCVERTDLPGRRIWAVVAALPITVPAFVTSYSWVSVTPAVQGFAGATMIVTLAYYPLVYLPVAAVLRGTDPALEESARSLGLGPVQTFRRVTLPQTRVALLGGSLLVAIHTLAEFGAFSMLRFQTFTTAIYDQYRLSFNGAAASTLATVLVLMCLLLLMGELRLRGRDRYHRTGAGSRRPVPRARLGHFKAPVLAALTLLAGASLGLPFATLIYWTERGSSAAVSGDLVSAAATSLELGLAAAALTTLLALPVAILAVRFPSPLATLIERSTYLAYGLPGIVVGLALIVISINFVPGIYGTTAVLLVAYAILALPLALVAVRGALAQVPPVHEEVARSLGLRPWAARLRVTLPAIIPGLGAAAALVFLATVTELTATLLLAPIGTNTLATGFWSSASTLSYAAAAPYAALMVLISAIPTYLLTRRAAALGGLTAS